MDKKLCNQEISRTVAGDNPVEATTITGATFQINNAKLYAPIVILSVKDNIKFLQSTKQRFRITVSWNKYRSEITAQSKNNNLDHVIDQTFRKINRLFVFSFKNSDDDPIRNSFDEYYMLLVKVKDFNTLTLKYFLISL